VVVGQRVAAAVLVVTFLVAGTCRTAAGSADDVEVELVGFLRLPPSGGMTARLVTFLLTPRTTSRRTSLRDGEPVTLAVVNGRRLVVGIETSESR